VRHSPQLYFDQCQGKMIDIVNWKPHPNSVSSLLQPHPNANTRIPSSTSSAAYTMAGLPLPLCIQCGTDQNPCSFLLFTMVFTLLMINFRPSEDCWSYARICCHCRRSCMSRPELQSNEMLWVHVTNTNVRSSAGLVRSFADAVRRRLARSMSWRSWSQFLLQ